MHVCMCARAYTLRLSCTVPSALNGSREAHDVEMTALSPSCQLWCGLCIDYCTDYLFFVQSVLP